MIMSKSEKTADSGFHTTLCYITRGDDVLLLHRTKKKNDINEGKWIGVGGKLEPGETAEQCLLREVREETGLTLTSWRERGIITFSNPPYPLEYMHLFTADAFTGTLTVCDEGDLAWVPRQKVLTLPTWEGDRIFLRLLAEDAPYFSLALFYDGDKLLHAELNGKQL